MNRSLSSPSLSPSSTPLFAFQPPALLNSFLSSRSSHPTSTTSLRPTSHPHCPACPPPPPSTRLRRSRSVVIAWLTAHSDSAVLSAATRSSARVVPLRGPLSHIVQQAHALRPSHLYLSAHYLTTHPNSLPILSSLNLILVPVASSLTSPLSTPLLAASAITTPLLVERKGAATVRFFDENSKDIVSHSNAVPQTFRQEKDIDDRPWMTRLTSWLTRVYLPRGYPHTTTPDYLSFTKYRTIQNLASAIMQVISTEALLFGLGLGEKVAAGAAATSWVLKDGVSYIVKIGYGSLFGSKFDEDPKSYRIAADIVEDIGGAVEILTPLFARSYFLPLASLAVCLRGMSLMTGTATRHVVYRSLAARGMQNTGDIATKGESQGVTCKMIGLAAGIVISSRIGQNYYALLATYTLLAGIHITANWKSVQCVQFSFLNKQRASILIDNHLQGHVIPSPYDVSHREKIILPPWRGFDPSVRIGASVSHARITRTKLTQAKRLFRGEHFLILADESDGHHVSIFLRQNASSMDALRAYFVVKCYKFNKNNNNDKQLDQQQHMSEALKQMRRHISLFTRKAEQAGWDTTHMLVTDGQTRVDW